MYSLSAGLVLRYGDRTLQFERQVSDTEVQFKYLDNFKIVTLTNFDVYAKVHNREFTVVHQNGNKVQISIGLDLSEKEVYPTTLTDAEVDEIEFKLIYIKKCLREKVSPGSIEQIRNCLKIFSPPQKDGTTQRPQPSVWTVRSWLKKYTASAGAPLSLIDRRSCRQHFKRLDRRHEDLVGDAIRRHYMQKNGLTARATWRKLRDEIKHKNRAGTEELQVPSMSTVLRRINDLDKFDKDYARISPDYARNKWRYSLSGSGATRVLERVEVDHTWLDIWVLDPRTGIPLGRPWITVMIDRFSGYILGLHISFYGPSTGTVASAMLNAITPKNEILLILDDNKLSWTASGAAELYVLDNGLEFHSRAFLRMAWHLRSDLLFNRVRTPWLKPSIERCMMEVCRVLPQAGKVYKPKPNFVPQNPKKGALIVFDDLCKGLLRWACDVHPKQINEKRLIRPQDLWDEGLSCALPPRYPESIEEFQIISGITAHRTISGDGAFFNYLRFNSPELQDYHREKGNFRTEIRFNPDDLSSIYIYLPREKSWLATPLQHSIPGYGDGLSMIQHEIIRKQAGDRLTKNNAEEVLAIANSELQDFYSHAMQTGIGLRKHSNLIRLQGLTSSNVYKNKDAPPTKKLPEASEKIISNIENLMPFKSFSLEEELL